MLTCQRDPEFRRHLGLYEVLGIDGMSSEEDAGPHPQNSSVRVRKVTRKAWLASWVTKLNDKVDLAAEGYARMVFMKGSKSRPRTRANEISTNSKVVVGMPSNVYSARWLASLSSPQREAVAPSDEIYPM